MVNFKDMQNINKIILSQLKLKDIDPSCANFSKSIYCQEYNLQTIPFISLNQTIKTCTQELYLYVFPSDSISEGNSSAITILISLLTGK